MFASDEISITLKISELIEIRQLANAGHITGPLDMPAYLIRPSTMETLNDVLKRNGYGPEAAVRLARTVERDLRAFNHECTQRRKQG